MKYLEPDSPNSMDQLIGPQSPDIADQLLQKRPNMRASAESIDELLRQEGASGHDDQVPCAAPVRKGPFSYQRVFDYDVPMDSLDGGGNCRNMVGLPSSGAAAAAAAAAQGEAGEEPAGKVRTEGGGGSASSAPATQQADGGIVGLGVGGTSTDDSTGDSGKSSLENMSQTDSASQVSGISSNSCPPGQKQAGNASNNSSAKQTLTHPCSPAKSGPKSNVSPPVRRSETDWSKHSVGDGANGGDSNRAVVRQASPSQLPSPTYPALVPGSQNGVPSVTGIPQPQFVDVPSADPWEMRFPLQEQQQAQYSQQQQQQNNQRGGAASAGSGPKYVNVELARNNLSGSKKNRQGQTGRRNNNMDGSGRGASSHEKSQSRNPPTYRPPIASMSETRRDEEASKDPGDSGVVIDFKDTANRGHDSKGQTWL